MNKSAHHLYSDHIRLTIEHRAKADGTLLFGTRLLEPPPVALLIEGAPLQLLRQEAESSQVRTLNGLRGWVRNDNVVAVKVAEGGDHRLGDQEIHGDEWNHSEIILDSKPPLSGIIGWGLDRGPI